MRVGGDDRAPKVELLGTVQEQAPGMAFKEHLPPDTCQPGVPCEDRGRPPGRMAFGSALAVEVEVERAGGALVAGDRDAATAEEFVNLMRQAPCRLHLSFIRFAGEEIRVESGGG